MFLLPTNHDERMASIIARFNRELGPYIADRVDGASNDDEIVDVVRNLTHNVVMDMLTVEDTIYFSKMYLAGIFREHINKILKKGNDERQD